MKGSICVVHFFAGQGRNEGADDPHAGNGADPMAVMVVHGIEGAGLDLVNLAL